MSFGGPDGPDDVMPFLERVLRGRPVPPDRLAAVASHYFELGGASPINGHNRALLAALRARLSVHRPGLPVYWGNRNWHPHLDAAVAQMSRDGIRHAAAFVTSAYSSYSGCRQYVDDIEAARAETGAGAPRITKLRPFFNHPGFVGPLADSLRSSARAAGQESPVLMSAHSIPVEMANTCAYEAQLHETARLVADAAGVPDGRYQVVYQSRSGPPTQPWLGPDVNDAVNALPAGTDAVVVAPIGFVSDHMEVVYDLDRQAAATAASRGIRLLRSATPGTHPAFVEMVVDLVEEAEGMRAPAYVGAVPPRPCPCPDGCRPGL